MSRIADLLDEGEHFFRGSFLGHTWLLVLLGAGSADATPSALQIAALVLIGFNYHLFGYLHNNLIDLPVDRTQPLRANDPLVAGRISERHTWWIAGLQIPTSFVIASSVGADLVACSVLATGYLTTIFYNLYGKRCPLPMLTDALQGVAWGSLALFGVYLVGDTTPLSWVPIGFGFAFIFLINGVHGGLRDLKNDTECGRMTTAIFFGAVPVNATDVRSTPTLQAFAALAFSLILLPTIVLLVDNRFGFSPGLYVLVCLVWGLNTLWSLVLLWQVVRTHQPDRNVLIYKHQRPLLLSPIIVMLAYIEWPLALTVLACFFGPFGLFLPQFRRFLSLGVHNLFNRPPDTQVNRSSS